MRRGSSRTRGRLASLVALASALGSLPACNALLDDFVYVDASVPPGDEVTPGLDAGADASFREASADTGEDGSGDDGGGGSPAIYEQLVLEAKPAAYWRLDESVGAVATNAASAEGTYNAQYYANVQLGVPGAIVGDTDTAIHLSGATGAVVLAGGFAMFGTRPFTLELWMRPTVPASNAFELLVKAESPSAAVQIFYQETGGSALHGVEYLGGVGTYANSTTEPGAGWSYVALESDGTKLLLFLNGRQVDVEPLANLGADAGDAGNAGATFSIGGDENGSSPFTGDVDEVAVYGRQLAPAEIGHHYAVGSGRDAGM